MYYKYISSSQSILPFQPYLVPMKSVAIICLYLDTPVAV